MEPVDEKSSSSATQAANPAPVTEAPAVSGTEQKNATVGHAPMHFKSRKIVFVAVLLIIAAASVAYVAMKQFNKTKPMVAKPQPITETEAANRAFLQKNKDAALEHAKKAFADAPNDPDAALTVANLIKERNPEDAKQYYAKVLEIYETQNNLASGSSNAIVYWAAASSAENAGNTEKAKLYYEQVIKTANMSDSYQNSIAQQSQAALKRLK